MLAPFPDRRFVIGSLEIRMMVFPEPDMRATGEKAAETTIEATGFHAETQEHLQVASNGFGLAEGRRSHYFGFVVSRGRTFG